MKKKKTIIGIIIILGLVLFIPRGNTNTNDTIYLNPNESTPIYNIFVPGERERFDDDGYVIGYEFIQWSFRTYDNSFIVDAFCLSLPGRSATADKMLSEDKTSNSGELSPTQKGDATFSFYNSDIIGGYINIKIWIKEEEIDYTIFLYFFIPILIVSIIIIGLYYQRYQRQKQLKGMGLK